MKAKEVHAFSDEEIKVEEARLRKELLDLRTQAVTEKLDNPSRFPAIRHDIARLLTEKNARTQAKAKA